jgi:hypothetical protein
MPAGRTTMVVQLLYLAVTGYLSMYKIQNSRTLV